MEFDVEKTALHNANFGCQREDFPSLYELRQIVEKQKAAKDVVILSICELSEKDYNTFWGELLHDTTFVSTSPQTLN